jgi:hypothetical protein
MGSAMIVPLVFLAVSATAARCICSKHKPASTGRSADKASAAWPDRPFAISAKNFASALSI